MTTFFLIVTCSALAAWGMCLSQREQVKTAETKNRELISLLMETRDLLDASWWPGKSDLSDCLI